MEKQDRKRPPARAERQSEPDLLFMLNCYDVWSLRPADRACPEPMFDPAAD